MLTSRQNQYNGVNAHYISGLQEANFWSGFHATYIIDLLRVIEACLPEDYYVSAERGLQMREVEDWLQNSTKLQRPDVTVLSDRPIRQVSRAAVGSALVIPSLDELEDDDDSYPTLAIYEAPMKRPKDEPITRIELLSPSNKHGTARREYLRNRQRALQNGVNCVDIDFHHFLPVMSSKLPIYPYDDDSFPYGILISNPYPSVSEGRTLAYRFAVDDPIPTLDIPLANDDFVSVDFDSPFQSAFASTREARDNSDYTQLPDNFDSYSPNDQARIQVVMARVQNVPQSINLNQQRVL